MKNKILLVALVALIGTITFYIGTISGKYMHGLTLEDAYPFHLRDIFIVNQPNCETYYQLKEKKEKIDISIVTDKANNSYVRIFTLHEQDTEIKFLVSVLNDNHDQFIDEVWLECTP